MRMSGMRLDTAVSHDKMTPEEAVAWLEQVDGELYRTPAQPTGRAAWVAVVRTPARGARRGRLIVALGDSLQEATNAAASQWRECWRTLSEVH
jgi:hypothetical protein